MVSEDDATLVISGTFVSAKTVVTGIKPGVGVGVLLLPGVARGVGVFVAALSVGRTETTKSDASKKESRTRIFLDAIADMHKS